MVRRAMMAKQPIRGTAAWRAAALYRPRSLVLWAAPGVPEAPVLAANLAGGGFKGQLHAIGIAQPGLAPAESLAALPAAPDLAVLCLPPAEIEPAMRALAGCGCFAAIIPGAVPGLGAISARTGVRALGQGSFGLAVPAIGLNATLSHLPPLPGKLALVTQSAALARAVLDWAAAEGLGFSHVIGIGGNATLGFAAALDWLARDPGTGAVLLDLRRIRNRRAFISAARATTRTRPVVAIRAGGRAADREGVGDQVMAAALRRAGVLRVEGLEDLLAATETLARLRPRPGAVRGDRVAIVSNGRGIGQLAADALIAGGGRLAEFSPAARAALAALLPGGAEPDNPLVLGPAAGPHLAEASAMLAALPEVDAVVALHAPGPGPGEVAAEALAAAAKAGGGRAAPLLLGWLGQATAGPQRQALTAAGLAVFTSPEAAVRGALHLAEDHRNRAAAAELPPRAVLELAPDQAAVRRLFAAVRAAGRLALTEEESLGVLAAYGLPTIPGRRAAGPKEAADAAALLGFPAVLKLLSADLPHKSEVGGVRLGLTSAAAVRQAAEAMLKRVAERRPEAHIAGFLVQRQAGRALELRLRLGEDKMFGPWIGFGQGGTTADLLGDEAFDLPPLNLALARQLISRSRAAQLLAGFRDWPPANPEAVAEALVRLSQLAVDFPEIATLSVNPLFADAEGVLAADAYLVLRPAGERGELAIAPYPAELAGRFRARGGAELLVRPIRPEDAAAHGEAFRRLSAEDVRWRFFSPLKEMSPALAARLTQIDYDREMAFVAIRRPPEAPEEILGVARLIREPNSPTAEFAVVVLPEMKSQGLGRHLMQRIIDWGRAAGVGRVLGHVLADNAPMLAFMRSLGFTLRRSPEEEEVYEAVLELPEAR
ncbi:bifunctional acetate--CoA ligase family protein/GNAT family N-acetyltransferase [Siccirubricoccus phaeus]|uniref:bifunctional acetate--CoA ligase family protein/GNAT family N-acetyltransferase n=1 Tax=Siccirubricoccus phaeus TaxID=2595053 RepID=UPI001F2187E3|nr:GNAT family N-acetyltransferase [Siccirubricoccus phaeus]